MKGLWMKMMKMMYCFRIDKESTITRRSGFTLIEILVALTILAIIIATVYGAFSGTVRIIRSGSLNWNTHQYGRLAIESIRRDLMGALPSQIKDEYYFQGIDNSDGNDPNDSIDFVTTSHIMADPGGNKPESEVCEVGYSISEEHDGILVRRLDLTVDSKPFSGGWLKPISENIVGLNFQYYNGKEWLDQWDPEAELEEDEVQVTGLPMMIRVEVIVKDDNGDEHASSAVVLLALGSKIED